MWAHCLNYVTVNSSLAETGIDASLMGADQWVWDAAPGRDAEVAYQYRDPVQSRVSQALEALGGGDDDVERPADRQPPARPPAFSDDDRVFDALTGEALHRTACTEDCNCSTLTEPALRGMDITTYFPDSGSGSVSEGSAEFQAEFGGFLYYFANATNRDTFRANPVDYLPMYGGFCSYGIATE